MRFVLLARQWRRALDAQLSALNLTDAGWPPLVHLAAGDSGLTQRELADRIGINGSSLVRLLDQHAQAGLIERREDPQDRRTWRLFLTREGRTAVRRIQAVLDKVETRMLAGLSDAQLLATLAAFDRVAEGIAALEDAR